MKYEYDYPMFSLAVDIAVIDPSNRVLLIRRGGDTHNGKLAFPGGFVDINEKTEYAALREIKEETNLDLHTWDIIHPTDLVLDDVNRDPRGRVVSLVYNILLNESFENYNLKAGDDANSLEFHSLTETQLKEGLAFDHYKIWDYLWS